MADPNAQIAQQEFQWVFQALGLSLDSVSTTTDVFTKALSPLDSDPYIKQLNSAISNNECDISRIDRNKGESIKDFEKRVLESKNELQNAGIFYHVQKVDNSYMFITLKSERDKVMNVFNKDESYINNSNLMKYSSNNVMEFTTSDEATAYMFMKRCKVNNVPVKIDSVSDIRNKSEMFKIRFAAKDLEKMNAIRRNVVIDMTDDANQIRRRQIQYESSSTLKNLNETMNLENAGGYIVGENGMTIKVDKNAVSIIDQEGNIERVIKGQSDTSQKIFGNKVLSTITSMGATTYLTAEEYSEYLKTEEKRDFLIDVQRKDGRPELTESEKEILKKSEIQREKIEAKLIQDHPDEVRVNLNDYNNEESFETFKTNEKINYEVSHDIEESQYSDPNFLDDARALNDGLVAETPEVDIEADVMFDDIQNEDIDVNIPDDMDHSIEDFEEDLTQE